MAHSQVTNQSNPKAKRRLFFILWIFCIFGSWSTIPYLQYLKQPPSSVSFFQIFLLTTAQAMLLFGVVCWLSYLLVPKTDLLPFSTDKPLKKIVYPGAISGLLVGLVIYLLDITIFKKSLLLEVNAPPAWTGLLASFYGGINEEVLLRLFLFTLIYFLFRKIFRFEIRNRLSFLWITNIIVAIAFGVGHLPLLFKFASPSSFEIFRVLLLNGIPGIVFGWLYWSKGLWTAMAAHYMADLVLHVFVV